MCIGNLYERSTTCYLRRFYVYAQLASPKFMQQIQDFRKLQILARNTIFIWVHYVSTNKLFYPAYIPDLYLSILQNEMQGRRKVW